MASGVPSSGSLLSARTRHLFLALGGLGIAAFLYGVAFGDDVRAWQSLLINFLFFAGLAHAGVVISALFQATSARWSRSLKRAAEATAGFMPIGFALLLVLLAGVGQWAPWVDGQVVPRQVWLNVPFFVLRQLLGFVVLGGLSLAYVYVSLRPDIGMLDEAGERPALGLAAWVSRDWRGLADERRASQARQDRLAPAVLLTYGIVFSLVGVDFVMALDPVWYSTLVGAYFFVGTLFVGVAFLTVVATWGRDRLRLQEYVGTRHVRDMATLLFGFCIMWGYTIWSQYLVIWYGDLPEETEFVIHRMEGAWAPVTWSVVGLAFLVPFLTLLSRALKGWSHGVALVALAALVGLWLERFVLIAPSLWHGTGLPLGLVELLITVGVLGLFAVSYDTFLRAFPPLAVSDPKLTKVTTEA